MERNDVILTPDGRLFQVTDLDPFLDGSNGRIEVQFIDRDEPTYVDRTIIRSMNLGQKPEVLAAFVTARSVHLRLNRMNRI